MTTTRRALRTALLAGLCTLAACVVNLGFDMSRTVAVASAGGATSISQTQAVNLSDYKEIQEHKGSIRSLDLDSADISVQTVNAANRATVVNGTMLVRKSLTDANEVPVTVGTLNNFKISQGSTVRLPGSPALDAFLTQQVTNGGSFYIVVQGNIDQAPIDVVLNVTMHASLGYDAGL
jgi:hypothetical protein